MERWFADLTACRLRRGTFTTVEAMLAWAATWNKDAKPFVWRNGAEDISEQIRRGRATLNEVKSATGD
jgi:hypothetical protein